MEPTWLISFQLIPGCMLGLEIVGSDDVNDPNISWGIVLDILIIRLVFLKY